MRKVFIRADGNKKIGMGHFYRSLALAEILQSDFFVVFAICFPNAHQQQEINNVCNEMLILPDDESHYSQFIHHLTGNEIVVLDNYFFKTNYQVQLKEKGVKLVCIDDTFENYFVSDYVINTAPVDKNRYQHQITTQVKTGPSYALLRASFLNCAGKGELKPVENFRRVFLSFGSDPLSLTANYLKQLAQLPFVKEIVVIAQQNKENKRIIEVLLSSRHNLNINLLYNLTSEEMLTAMQKCDFALVSSSVILYEVLAAGLPAITGFYIDNQINLFQGVVANKIEALPIGNLRTGDLSTLNFKQLKNLNPRKTINNKSKNNLLNLFYSLDKELRLEIFNAKQSDCDILYRWANDPEIRKQAINSEFIKYDVHVNWFNKQLSDPNSYFYIFKLANKHVGLVRFNRYKNMARISYLVNSDYRGKGFGKLILKLGILKLIDEETPVTILKAEVKMDNFPSQKAFIDLGFKEMEQEIINGNAYKIYRSELQKPLL